MTNKIELLKSADKKFVIKLTLDVGRAGKVQFLSVYPYSMSQLVAEARLYRLSEMYGYDREHLPYINAMED